MDWRSRGPGRRARFRHAAAEARPRSGGSSTLGDQVGACTAALRPGDFAGLGRLSIVFRKSNALSTPPAGVFDGLDGITLLNLTDNALAQGGARGRGVRAAEGP